jgi:ATP-dependent 26S proteasome regulatory subunit
MQVVSSAIVDKYIGESARVIREMFGYAREHQPCVIFMDEIDAIGGRRFSEGTSADREIQRTLMELLSQLDGFDVVGKVRRTSSVAGCVAVEDFGHFDVVQLRQRFYTPIFFASMDCG